MRHARPTPIRQTLVSALLGVAWTAATIAGFAIGFRLADTSEHARPGVPVAQQPATGPLLVGIGGCVLAFFAGAQISLLRDRRHHPKVRYKALAGSRYLTIDQSLRNNLWPMLIGVCLVVAGLLLTHYGG